MTAPELLHDLRNVVQGAGPTTSKRVLGVLNATIQFLETLPAADSATASPSDDEGVVFATAAPSDFKLLATQCADELDEALALKVGVMDSESKAAAVVSQQLGAMQSVAARLREA